MWPQSPFQFPMPGQNASPLGGLSGPNILQRQPGAGLGAPPMSPAQSMPPMGQQPMMPGQPPMGGLMGLMRGALGPQPTAQNNPASLLAALMRR